MKYLLHKLTLYHYRYNKKAKNRKLAMCTCGWSDKFMRTPWQYRMWRPWCKLVGHKLEEEGSKVSFGEADHTDESADQVLDVRLCERCLYAHSDDIKGDASGIL